MTSPEAIEPADVGRRGRQAARQLLGRAVAFRAITFLGTLVLARVLAPEDFGVYAVLFLWAAAIALIGDGGVAASLIQQPSEPTPRELGTAWVLQQLVWVPLVAGTWVLAPVISAAFPGLGPDFAIQLGVAAVVAPLIVQRMLPNAMLSRVMRFGTLAVIEVVQHTTFYVIAVALALSGARAWSLIVALFAQAIVGVVLAYAAWPRWPRPAFDREVARRQVGFGLGFMGSSLVNLGRESGVPVVGALAGGVASIGLLQFAFRVGQILSTLDEVVGRITFPAFSRLQEHRERTGTLLRDVVVGAAVVIAGVQVWLAAAAPVAVPIAFGDQWTEAIPALQAVCLGTLVAMPIRPVRSLLFGLGRSRTAVVQAAISLVVALVLAAVAVALVGLVGGGLAFIASSALALWMHARAISDVVTFPWRDLAMVYAVALASGLAAHGATLLVDGIPGLVLSAAVFAAVDLPLLWLLARPALRIVGRLVRRVPSPDA